MVAPVKRGGVQQDDPIDWFTFRVLQRATGNFGLKNCVGEGQNGRVYHGRLLDGSSVAVKRFKPNIADPQAGIVAEMKVQRLLSLRTHPHVRHLLGVSFDPKDPLIVYEFMAKGSLRQHIQGRKGNHLHNNAFNRLSVAIDVANALCELHYNARFPIFHRDVKSSNVLLDENHRAKLADLGIAVVVKTESDSYTPVPLGAFGYKCPVYEQTCHLDDKSDVYSFGVLLMELATFLTAWDLKRPVTLLVNLVLDRLRTGKAENLIQPGKAAGGLELMKSMLQIAAQCCSLDLYSRPNIDQVASALVGLSLQHAPSQEEEAGDRVDAAS